MAYATANTARSNGLLARFVEAAAARKVYRTTLTELEGLSNRDLADLCSRRLIAHPATRLSLVPKEKRIATILRCRTSSRNGFDFLAVFLLAFPHFGVDTVCCHEYPVRPALHNLAALEDQDFISIDHR